MHSIAVVDEDTGLPEELIWASFSETSVKESHPMVASSSFLAVLSQDSQEKRVLERNS